MSEFSEKKYELDERYAGKWQHGYPPKNGWYLVTVWDKESETMSERWVRPAKYYVGDGWFDGTCRRERRLPFDVLAWHKMPDPYLPPEYRPYPIDDYTKFFDGTNVIPSEDALQEIRQRAPGRAVRKDFKRLREAGKLML